MSRILCWIAHRDPTNPLAGGAERGILEISAELNRLGWEVQLISGGYPGCNSDERLGSMRVIRGSGPAMMHLELPALLRKCNPFDVVVEDLGHVVPFVGERFTRAPGVVFFRHLHRRTLPGQVNVPARWMLEAIERAYPLIYRRWPFVAPSQSALTDLRGLGLDISRLNMIGYGVDLETFHLGTLSETPSLIYFAGLRRYKRPEHALYALKILIRSGIVADLSIAGDGPELGPMMNLSRSLGIDDHVKFVGRVSDQELSALLSKSWAHIQCSIAEGWGLTVSEAAASGVPTVAYSVPGLVDSVVPGVSGILVEDGDTAALARALSTVIRDRAAWTSRCRSSVIGRSWELVAREWDRLLTRLSTNL